MRMKGSFTPKEKLIKALQKGRRYKFRELRGICGISNKHLQHLIAECRHEGYKIVYGKLDRTFFLSKAPTPYSDAFDMSWLPQEGKLGIISDTHLCSQAERLDIVNAAYDRYVEEGITTVLHAGDISDGWQVYRGHEQHIKVAGCHNQAKYVIENYPSRKGVTTFFIGGNHDLKSYEKQGIDQCSLMVNGFDHEGKHYDGRKDMIYLGQYSRNLIFPNEVQVQILHPHGGGTYSKSYPQQKRAREMRSDTRPAMQLSGHFHTFNWTTEDYTHMIALPGVQDETEFFVRLGFGRQMGFSILDYTLGFIKFERVKLEVVSML